MKIFILGVFLAPVSLFAVSGGTDYDIVPRTVNFLIFFAILLYFVAKPAKEFYQNRISKIASRLEDIQKRVLESKNKKLELIKKLEDAKKEALVAKESAKKEAEIIALKIKNETKNELAVLDKQLNESMDYEERKMQREVISELLNETFDKLKFSQEELTQLMLKKVC